MRGEHYQEFLGDARPFSPVLLVTRDDTQQRLLAQHSGAMLEQRYIH